jgi:hypothetical protein
MTPKEKAKELIDKMYATQGPEYGITEDEAKQCALISVDEIIELLVDLSKGFYTFSNNLKYYEKVKEEINKL